LFATSDKVAKVPKLWCIGDADLNCSVLNSSVQYILVSVLLQEVLTILQACMLQVIMLEGILFGLHRPIFRVLGALWGTSMLFSLLRDPNGAILLIMFGVQSLACPSFF